MSEYVYEVVTRDGRVVEVEKSVWDLIPSEHRRLIETPGKLPRSDMFGTWSMNDALVKRDINPYLP